MKKIFSIIALLLIWTLCGAPSCGGGGGGNSGVSNPPSGSLPTVTTNPATGIGQTSVDLQGTVNPNNSSTNTWFEWGTDSSLGNTTSSTDIGSDSSDVGVSKFLSGLSSNTTYYYRIAAQNNYGTAYGATFSFTTSSEPATGPPGVTLPQDYHIHYIEIDNDSIYVGGPNSDSLGDLTTSIFLAKFNPDSATPVWNKNVWATATMDNRLLGMKIWQDNIYVVIWDGTKYVVNKYSKLNGDLISSTSVPTCGPESGLAIDSNGIYFAGFDSDSINCFMKMKHDGTIAWIQYLNLHSPAGQAGWINEVISDGTYFYMTGSRAYDTSAVNDAFVVKCDTDGNDIWWQEWSRNNDTEDVGLTITVSVDNSVYTGVRTRTYQLVHDPVLGDYWDWVDSNGYLLKYDSAGNLAWTRQLVIGQQAYGITNDGSAVYYAAGPIKVLPDNSIPWSSDTEKGNDIGLLNNLVYLADRTNSLSIYNAINGVKY